jgi:glycosyltransferase involved in cell wall biosynthesis
MTRIVTITPLAAENDSRTLKHATSLARLGYDSVVVEALASKHRSNLPFQLITIESGSLPSFSSIPAVAPSEYPWWRSVGSQVLSAAPPSMARVIREPADRLTDSVHFLQDYHRGFMRPYWIETARALPEASLYYLHGYFQAPAAFLAARRHGAPLVYDARDFYPVIFDDNTPHARLVKRPLLWWDRVSARRAAAFTTVSDGVADLYESAYGRRPIVIRNCHDRRLDEPAASTVRRDAGVREEDFLVVAVGHAKPGDAFDEMVVAVEHCPEVHVAFVGNQDGRAEAVRSRPAADRLHFLPPVSPRQLSDYIKSADVAAILYTDYDVDYANALPNRFFFPVAAGLPVLYPPLSEIKRLAESLGLGVPIDPMKPDSVAAAMRELATDPERVTALRQQVESARLELSWEGEEAVLGEMIDRVLTRRTRR